MNKIFISIFSALVGLSVILFWDAITIGKMRFRPGMLEDWIVSLIILISFSIPIILFVKWCRKKIRSKNASENGPKSSH